MFSNIITILDKEYHMHIHVLEPPYSYLDFDGKFNDDEDAWDEPWPPGHTKHDHKICLRPAINGEVDTDHYDPTWVPAGQLQVKLGEYARNTNRRCDSYLMIRAARGMAVLTF